MFSVRFVALKKDIESQRNFIIECIGGSLILYRGRRTMAREEEKEELLAFSHLDELVQASSDSNLNLQDGVTLKIFIECQSLQVYCKFSN
ncbi:hypothetical protein HanHA300_Chr14g0521361 [Helianthus annuus]|nr:hypothetical protein HanHA300_Chr14g0521361 [Helianthus annuus]KAJ0485438.1 hypothetical protein HanHA89_Chr14g0568331 [Helianthus annuus]KAJ0655989.1 hypothetical protein HanLR1_Chr14g0530701 [Helianthus annuus]KAJ0659666.1 hypothetical protein HanOQP8_Chr14g0528791 [Helianthus annuus]